MAAPTRSFHRRRREDCGSTRSICCRTRIVSSYLKQCRDLHRALRTRKKSSPKSLFWEIAKAIRSKLSANREHLGIELRRVGSGKKNDFWRGRTQIIRLA